MKNFEVWQVEWLWNGLEPYNGEATVTRAYATFRRLKEDLAAGLVKDVNQKDGSWKNVTLSRQQWVDYAYKVGERPAFLFPEQRTWLSRLYAALFSEREALPSEIPQYHSIYICYSAGQQMTPPIDPKQVREWLIGELKRGAIAAIGRPRRGGIDHPYIKIPQRYWRHMTFDWADSVTYRGREYVSLQFKQLKRTASDEAL